MELEIKRWEIEVRDSEKQVLRLLEQIDHLRRNNKSLAQLNNEECEKLR